MAKSVMVIGLGRFGSSVARTLFQLGFDVLGIDTDEKIVQGNVGQLTYSVQGDATNEATLRDLGAANFDASIVAIGTNLEVSLMASVLLATLEAPLIIARARDPLHGNTLQRIGVHRIIYPEQEIGEVLAHSLFNPDVLEYMDLTKDFGISKMKLPDVFIDSTLREAGFVNGSREHHGVTIIGLKRGQNVIFDPDQNDKLRKGDILIVAGKDDNLERLHLRKVPVPGPLENI